MSFFLKVLKINLLSLLAFPLFLVAILTKMLSKALEKVFIIIGAGAAMVALLILNSFLNNPNEFLEGLGIVVAAILIFGSIVIFVGLILFLFGGLAAFIVAAIVNLAVRILTYIFDFSHDLYSKCFDICKSNYADLLRQDNAKGWGYSCVLFHLLRGFNRLIVTLFRFALPLSYVLSLCLLVFSYLSWQASVDKSFGIGLWQYLNLFPKINMVFAIIYFVVMVGAAIVIIISLGSEWSEWGEILQFSTQNYQEYRNILYEQSAQLHANRLNSQFSATSANSGNAERCQEYMKQFQELVDEAETLQQQVDMAMSVRYESTLLYDFNEYIQGLNNLLEELSAFKGSIPCDIFANKFIPSIDAARNKANDIAKKIQLIIESQSSSADKAENTAFDFFSGCQNAEEVKRRYRALCKAYHPDSGGDAQIFSMLTEQYEQRMAEI